MTLTPAYGRDYTSKAKLLADFNEDKDFIYHPHNGRSLPINKSQILEEGTKTVLFRYAKLRRSFTHNPEKA